MEPAQKKGPGVTGPVAPTVSTGRVMKVSAETQTGAKKKRGSKERSSTVKPLTTGVEGERKRQKPKDKTLHVDKARAMLMTQTFPNQSLEEKKGLLFCNACKVYVGFKESVDVRQHVFGQQKKGEKVEEVFAAKSEEMRMKLGHYKALVRLAGEADKKTLIQAATETHRKNIFFESAGKLAMKGDTLPQDTTTDRVAVHMTLLELGIPITKLANPAFVELIEKSHSSLGGLSGVRSVQPIVRKIVLDGMKAAVAGRPVGITFDGSKVNFSVEGMLARFLNDDFMPVSLCVGAQAVRTALDSGMLRSLILNHLQDAGIAVENVVAFSSDSGSPNPTVMSEWKVQADALFFGQDLVNQNVQWLPCLMHAFSNSGTALRKALVHVKKFMSGFKTLVNESSAGCELWTRITGQACPGMSEKTFWAWYDRSVVLLDVWDKIPAFLAEAQRRGLAKKSIAKMAEAWKAKTLRAELLFCKTFGKAFHDASFELEGDGFCIPLVNKHLVLVAKLQQEVRQDRRLFRMITESVAVAVRDGLPNGATDPFVELLHSAADAVLNHFDNAVMRKMKAVLPLYQAASLLDPHRFQVEYNKRDFAAKRPAFLDLLAGLKCVPAHVRFGLDAEMVLYETEVRNRLAELAERPSLDTPSQLWMWWRGLRLKLPSFFAVASVLILMQPSSASIERFFATVKANTSAQQNGESHESLALRSMCLYNNRAPM